VQSGTVEAHLSDAFLNRVRAVYRRAIATTKPSRGQWAALDERRVDVHAALLSESNDAREQSSTIRQAQIYIMVSIAYVGAM